jgi:hypothetical protein
MMDRALVRTILEHADAQALEDYTPADPKRLYRDPAGKGNAITEH